MKDTDIAILCNGQFPDLYKESMSFYAHLPYVKKHVDGKGGFYNFKFVNHVIKTTKEYPYDWVILIDEDCFISDTNAMQELLNWQIENQIHISGMPDGGVIPLREFNPVGINTYFSILDLKSIRQVYNESKVMQTRYDKSLDRFIPHDLLRVPYNSTITQLKRKVDPFNFEPYYKIFFYLLQNGCNIKYLDAELWKPDADKFTNILRNHEGKPFAYHTWKARSFGQHPGHQGRIEKVIKHCHENSSRK